MSKQIKNVVTHRLSCKILVLIFINLFIGTSCKDNTAQSQSYPASQADRNENRVVVVERDGFMDNIGVALKQEVEVKEFSPDTPPDLVFHVKAAKEGRHWIITTAGVDPYGAKKMQEAQGKFESLTIRIAIDDAPPTERVAFVPWHDVKSIYSERTGKFDLTGKPQLVKIWLPKGLQLNTLELRPYTPPATPADLQPDYKPQIVPPESRPRLWVNSESLPVVRQRLSRGENAPVWEEYRATAEKPFVFDFKPGVEIMYIADLEQAAVTKAFVYLMTGNAGLGKEAVSLIRDYLSVVSFGNWLDITREIGRAIYSGSLVYDWCYDLISVKDRETIRHNLLRLADDMEIGWPPFLQPIVYGHGNEMQVSRDLLSMAIALYGDDPEPYHYCSWLVLENLRPMLAYKYQSPRHDQGSSYGPFRFQCDMHAAWLLRRMSGREVFHENIKQVPYSLIYQRLPDGSILPNGDGTYIPSYSRYENTLNFTYSNDPILKGEYLRHYDPATDPMRWLLLNDPDLVPQPELKSLPLTKDFGPIIGSMIARTGWNQSPDSDSDDIVVEMKGGGKHFSNHQHDDAGSFQIYYRGMQAGDLGVYGFYGTSYDLNFNKRSVSHSMILLYDPEAGTGNDGGARLHRGIPPKTPEQAETDPFYRNGIRRAAAFGPDLIAPVYSFFSVDLATAYSDKVKEYTRSFCFIRRHDVSVPAMLLVYDNILVSSPGIKKYWQINTFETPMPTADGIDMFAEKNGRKGRVRLSMLLPQPADRETKILTGENDVYNVWGVQYTIPPRAVDAVQTKGSRVLFSPKAARERDEFLTVMQMLDENGKALPISRIETDFAQVVIAGSHVVGFARSDSPIQKEWLLEIPGDREYQVVLTGMAAGKWSVYQSGKEELINVTEDNTTLYFSGKGTCRLVPPGGK